MAIRRPDWLTVIRNWVLRGGTGYTLPFLVGARVIRDGRTEASLDDAIAILDEMFHPQTPSDTLQLTWCPQLDAPVFGLNREQIDGVTIRSIHTQERSVVVRQDIVTRWGNSADKLVGALLDYSRAPIVAGNFSRMDRSWHPFSEEERQRIERLLQAEQPPA